MSHVAPQFSETNGRPSAVLPKAIRVRLQSIRHRQLLIAVLQSLLAALTVFVVAALIAILVDWYVVLFDTRVRLLLSCLAVIATVTTLVKIGRNPVSRALGWTRAAGRVDAHIPQMEGRWRTVASFAEAGTEPENAVSRVMLAQVTSEAAAMSTLVDPRRIADIRVLRRPLMAACVAGLVSLLLAAVDPAQSQILMQRFLRPWSPITATQVSAGPGNVTCPRGESVELTIGTSGLLRDSAIVFVVNESTPEETSQIELQANADQPGTFTAQLDVDESLTYRVQSGDGRTQWYQVTAIDYPAIADVRVIVTPPSYINEPATEKTLLPGRLRVPQGSRLEVAFKPEQELSTLSLELRIPVSGDEVPGTDGLIEVKSGIPSEDSVERDETTEPQTRWYLETVVLTKAADGWYHFETEVGRSFSLTPHLLSPHALKEKNSRTCMIDAVEDRAPVARILGADEDVSANADEKVEIKFEAHDDHGIASAELVIYDADVPEGEAPRVLAVKQIPLDDQRMMRHVNGKYELDLKELGLSEGQSITYAVRVTDSRMADESPQPGKPASENEGMTAEATSDDPPKQDAAAENTGAAEKDQSEPNTLAADTQAADTQVSDTQAAGEPKTGVPESGVPETGEPEVGEQGTVASNSAEPASDNPESDNPESDKPESDKPASEKTGSEKADDSEKAASPETIASTSPSTTGDQPSSDASPNGEPSSGEPSGRTPSGQPKESASGLEVSVAPGESRPPEMPQQTPQRSEGGAGNAGMRPLVAVRMNRPETESEDRRESGRRRIRIVGRLEAVAKSDRAVTESMRPMRERVVEIDRMLQVIEGQLQLLYRHEVEEAQRGTAFKEADARLEEVEQYVSALEEETRETAFEFIGLQMVDIAGTHVTPARDALFVAIRRPDAGADVYAEEALHHVISARELLQALLKRYDRVMQEQELAEKLDEAAELYTVYVERSQRLMREAQQNRDPLQLQREMAILEVDQAYLDRLAEVLRMRRDMMSELARILADDPRLRSRYLDLIRRRRSSLSSQLSELLERQEQTAREVADWLKVDDVRRSGYWEQVAEVRTDLPKELAKEAQQLLDRIEKQMPLVLDPGAGTAQLCIQLARQIALDVRRCELDVREMRKSQGSNAKVTLRNGADLLLQNLHELSAHLDRLRFENEEREAVTDFVELREIEVRAFADRAATWAAIARSVEGQQFGALVSVDQHQLTIATEILRTEMLNIESDLSGEFNDEVTLPAEVTQLAQKLNNVMESLVYNQTSATFALQSEKIVEGGQQQERAINRFKEAIELLNELRKKTVEALDKIEVEDPNIADLRDPTLDQFLAELEREPNIEAQLGIPNRPRNIRVLQDAMQWNQNGIGMLSDSANAARSRIDSEVNSRLRDGVRDDDPERKMVPNRKEEKPPEREMTQAEKAQDAADSTEAEKMLRAKLEEAQAELERQAADPNRTEEERAQLASMAEQMARTLEASENGQTASEQWERMVQADQAKAVLEALARGESIPDEQWNKLISTLGDGLEQVGGKKPPEDYRKAIEQYQDQIRRLTGRK